MKTSKHGRSYRITFFRRDQYTMTDAEIIEALVDLCRRTDWDFSIEVAARAVHYEG